MGVVHHSNYVRWMEEARVYMMDKMGYSYLKLESIGIASPVLGYTCDISHSTYFGDEVEIQSKIKEYNGVRLTIQYKMSVNEKVVALGETKHCFTNQKGMPIRLNKACFELDQILRK